MKIAVLYIGIAAAGYLAAVFLNSKKIRFGWIGKALPVIVTCLIFTMGFRIGDNREVVSNIGSIGLQSFMMALISLAFSVALLSFARRAAGYDRYGYIRKRGDTGTGNDDLPGEEGDGESAEKNRLLSPSTIRYLTAVIIGFVLGYLTVIRSEVFSYEHASYVTGTFVTYGLFLMVFLVGMDMGFDGSLPKVFRETGARAMVIPLAAAVGTMAAMVLCSLFADLGIRELACVGGTFGWYSLGPNIVMEEGLITAGAYAFLTNFLRDMLAILLTPWVAGNVGYVETIAMSQAASMDVCIATIEGATNKATTALAFFSGVLFTIAVPTLMPILAQWAAS